MCNVIDRLKSLRSSNKRHQEKLWKWLVTLGKEEKRGAALHHILNPILFSEGRSEVPAGDQQLLTFPVTLLSREKKSFFQTCKM